MSKITVEQLNLSLVRSKELAKDYSKWPVVKLEIWKDLRNKQAAIKERLHENVKK